MNNLIHRVMIRRVSIAQISKKETGKLCVGYMKGHLFSVKKKEKINPIGKKYP